MPTFLPIGPVAKCSTKYLTEKEADISPCALVSWTETGSPSPLPCFIRSLFDRSTHMSLRLLSHALGCQCNAFFSRLSRSHVHNTSHNATFCFLTFIVEVGIPFIQIYTSGL